MTQLTLLVLANSLWCLGIHFLATESFLSKIAEWITTYFEEKNLYWVTKPLYNCMPCMASVHGTIGFFIYFHTFTQAIVPYLVVLLGVNVLLSKYYYEG